MKYLTSKMNVFILIVILSFTLDNVLFQCSLPTPNTFLNNFVHHIISMYLWFGSLIFGNYLYHLLFLCVVLVFQYYNKWKCPITIEYNKQCGFNLKEHHKDIIYWINKNIFEKIPYYTFLKLLFVYDIYKLLLQYK
jgi:hypothetical protein